MLTHFAFAVATACAACPQDISDRVRDIVARSDGLASVATLGRSRDDRPIRVLTFAANADESPIAQRPGVLILAGLDGTRAADRELALYQAERLVDDWQAGDKATRELLMECVVWIVPEANPDGFARGRHGNGTPLDLDRDERFDEDAPTDVDGDGWITHMRWRDADGEFVIDDAEPRLMRAPRREDGERASHRYTREGYDHDRDGTHLEDDAQGVWLDRTFPHRFDEFDRRSGPFPTSEPETKALADFVYAHRNLTLGFVWGRDDNLLETPSVEKPKPRVQNAGILEGDKALFERAGELYRKLTGRKGQARARYDGSPWSWLYLQVGVPTFAADLWRSPELDGEDKKDALCFDKRRLRRALDLGRGFVEWRAFDHPELGEVEIGGFVVEDETALLEDARARDEDADRPPDPPPPSEADAAVAPQANDEVAKDESAPPEIVDRAKVFAAHHEFFLSAATWRAKCRIESFTAKALDDGAFQLDAVIVNDGTLPALTATAERTSRFSVPRIQIDLGAASMLAGSDRDRVENLLEHGGRKSFRWIVAGAEGATITLQLVADPVGADRAQVTL